MRKCCLSVLVFISLLLCSSCSILNNREITVARASRTERSEYFYRLLFSGEGLAFEAENFLRGNLLQDNFTKKPAETLQRLQEYYAISADSKYLFIAADLCRWLAKKASPEEAVQYHLSALYYCHALLEAQKGGKDIADSESCLYDLTPFRLMMIYDEACAGLFTYLKQNQLLNLESFVLKDAERHVFNFNSPVYNLSAPRESIEKIMLCQDYIVRDLMQRNLKVGCGVPLAIRLKTASPYRSLRNFPALTIPATLLVEMKKQTSYSFSLKLIYQDTSVTEVSPLKDSELPDAAWPLSLDFSTPLACCLNDLPAQNLLLSTLNPFREEETTGLYMVEPYQPGKIPVVFVHGVMSSPGTWVQVFNSLKNNPTIRKRYQFWFFRYSSGSPVPYTSSQLRQALLEAKKELCTTPEAEAAFEKTVLVGHSMGGLLSRCLLLDDPTFLVETITDCPWEEFKQKLTEEELQKVEATLLFHSLPFVHRVVFMAVPHRGAAMAQWSIIKYVTKLIRLPITLLDKTMDLQAIFMKKMDVNKLMKYTNESNTGIGNLDPDNTFIQWLSACKFKEDLSIHSIIGDTKGDNRPGGTDGIVPYHSSHLDGIDSELVVESGHSVHQTPGAIKELLRILLLNLRESHDNQ